MVSFSRYKIDRKNKTRKNKKMTEHFYYYVKDIIERLHIGGKRKLSNTKRSNKESKEFKEKLVELGWNSEYVKHTFRYLTDKLATSCVNRGIIWRINRRTRMEEYDT